MDENKINDKRDSKEFKGITFSGFKKTEAKKELLNNILDRNIEGSNYWCAELICCGSFVELWEIILLVACKHIYLSNFKLPFYLDKRYNNFRDIVINGYIDNELALRNNIKIRELFAEIITILTLSSKRNAMARIKLHKDIFDVTNIQAKLNADHANYCKNCYLKDDPKELNIAINELCFNLTTKNILTSCFWIEWIIEFETRCQKKKINCEAERRSFANVPSKCQKDVIWIVWHCLLEHSKTQEKYKENAVKSLLNLFCIRYTNGCKRKRIYLLYFCVFLLIEPVQNNNKLIQDITILDKIKSKLHLIYKQIKKNEVSPNTDYLFKDVKQNNLEKSLSKIEQMNAFNFVPRL